MRGNQLIEEFTGDKATGQTEPQMVVHGPDSEPNFHLARTVWRMRNRDQRETRFLVTKFAPAWASHGGKARDFDR